MKKLFFTAIFLIPTLAAWSGELTLTGSTDKAVPLYQPGEKMVFSVRLLDDSKPVAGKNLKWKRSGDDAKSESGDAVSSATEPLSLSTALNKPGFVRIEVWAVDEKGQPLLDAKKKPIRFDGGAGVEPEKLDSIPEPVDFDAYWVAQKAKLAQVPLKFTLTEIPVSNPSYVGYDVKIDCAGGKPVSGCLTKPKNAPPKSLPAKMVFHGYGVQSALPDCETNTLTLVINAHGIENGKDAAYYKDLAEGALKLYCYNTDDNAKPETCYFTGMFLRVMRGLEFLKAQPEWNGKDLMAAGGSQGGFQAIAATALDKNVTRCQIYVPWCCDLGGSTLGRQKGTGPNWVAGLGYFDTVNMAKRIQCETNIIAGLGDYVSPPCGVSILYNHLKGPKSLALLQGKTHSDTPHTPQDLQKIISTTQKIILTNH